MNMKRREKAMPFFDGSYWDYCIRTASDCFYIFSDGAVDVDFDKLNEKRRLFCQGRVGYSRSNGHIALEIVSAILENTLPADIVTQYTVRLERGELERLRTCRLILDEAPDKFDSLVKYPYYRMRGKPVTENQAIEVIRKTDFYIHSQFFQSRSCHASELVSSYHFRNCWFNPQHYSAHYGWVHPNGTVGINSVTGKWPTFLELLEELLGYQKAFPFLDFVAAFTWWVENPHYELWGGNAQEDEVSKQYPDFLDNVQYGVRLDGHAIEFLGRNRAVETYQEYEAPYGDSDFSVYIPESCRGKTCPFDMDAYYLRCIAAFGPGKMGCAEFYKSENR